MKISANTHSKSRPSHFTIHKWIFTFIALLLLLIPNSIGRVNGIYGLSVVVAVFLTESRVYFLDFHMTPFCVFPLVLQMLEPISICRSPQKLVRNLNKYAWKWHEVALYAVPPVINQHLQWSFWVEFDKLGIIFPCDRGGFCAHLWFLFLIL